MIWHAISFLVGWAVGSAACRWLWVRSDKRVAQSIEEITQVMRGGMKYENPQKCIRCGQSLDATNWKEHRDVCPFLTDVSRETQGG